MKQTQESQLLMENPTVNVVAIDHLQHQHDEETRQLADQIQARHANKYQHLKYMSPEMLNRATGHPVPQSVLPSPQSFGQMTDVYGQTSYSVSTHQLKDRDLKKQLEQRHQQIMEQKDRLGIQSYRQPTFAMGTTLEEAYKCG
jgi:hypothetical protein